MSTFGIYLLRYGVDSFLTSSTKFSERIDDYRLRYGDFSSYEQLGEYHDISVGGYGRLDKRLMYLWYLRVSPTMNRIIPGYSYFKKDVDRYGEEEVLKSYEDFEEEYIV